MRFMVIVKATKDSENEGAPPDPQLMADMNKFNDELLEAGVLLGYDGPQPSSTGARVHAPARTAPSLTAPSPKAKNSSPASGSGRSSLSKRPSSGSSDAPTPTKAKPT